MIFVFNFPRNISNIDPDIPPLGIADNERNLIERSVKIGSAWDSDDPFYASYITSHLLVNDTYSYILAHHPLSYASIFVEPNLEKKTHRIRDLVMKCFEECKNKDV